MWPSNSSDLQPVDYSMCRTNNVTGCHRGLKQKLRAGYSAPSRHRHAMCRHSYFCLLESFTVTHVIFFIVKCGIMLFLCAMLVSKVRASSSSPRLPVCRISFLWQPPLLSQPKKAYSINQSITHSPSLSDAL